MTAAELTDEVIYDRLTFGGPTERWQLFCDLSSWLGREAARRLSCSPDHLAVEEVLTRLEDRWEGRILARFAPDPADDRSSTVARFRAYLRRCVHRQVIDWCRSPRARNQGLSDGLMATAQGDEFTDADRDEIRHMIQKLSKADRKLIRLRYWEDLKLVEVAARLGRSLTTTYRDLKRVEDRLREQLIES